MCYPQAAGAAHAPSRDYPGSLNRGSYDKNPQNKTKQTRRHGGRSRVDIGRCEAHGAPRPPPQPTGPKPPLGPCPARSAPWTAVQAP